MDQKRILTVYITPDLETVLRPLTPNNAKALFELICQNKEHLSRLGDQTVTRYPSVEAVTRCIVSPTVPGKVFFGIWYQGKLVGALFLSPTDNGHHEIGYFVAQAYCRKNIATNTVTALVNHFYTSLGLWGNIYARTHRDNVASQKVLDKVGFSKYYTDEEVWFVFSD